MDMSMELVGKFCANELRKYMECVQSHPTDWNTACEQTKRDVAHCAQKNPIIQRIKSHCAVSFAEYDKCLERNPMHVEMCVTQLEAFAECAEKQANAKA